MDWKFYPGYTLNLSLGFASWATTYTTSVPYGNFWSLGRRISKGPRNCCTLALLMELWIERHKNFTNHVIIAVHTIASRRQVEYPNERDDNLAANHKAPLFLYACARQELSHVIICSLRRNTHSTREMMHLFPAFIFSTSCVWWTISLFQLPKKLSSIISSRSIALGRNKQIWRMVLRSLQGHS